jgi:CheY-like chemotaxis protein
MKNVLIVDDEKPILQMMVDLLVDYKEHFEVFTAGNGKEAVSVLGSISIDLVITDLKMPEMDGFELLGYISSQYPRIPVFVITAYETLSTQSKLKETGMLRLFSKPVNLDELTNAILSRLEGKFESGSMTGISLPNFMQLIEMEQSTCLMEIKTPSGKSGFLYFHNGILFDAFYNNIKSEKAVYAMLKEDNVKITFRSVPNKTYKKNIHNDLMSILLESARLNDEQNLKQEDSTANTTSDTKTVSSNKTIVNQSGISSTDGSKGDLNMADLKESLEKMKVIGGFMAVGAFTPNGELVADVNTSGINLIELGAIANDVLLKAQKATEMMNVGRGQVVHIEAPKAHVICRCLNEAADFSSTSKGKAHLHMVLILNKEEGNIALGKMKLEAVIQELAEFFR